MFYNKNIILKDINIMKKKVSGEKEKTFMKKNLENDAFEYMNKNKKIKKIKYFKYKNTILILFIKSFIYSLLFTLCLSKKISQNQRKLASPQIINITIVGQGSINIISEKSKINLMNVHFDDEIITDYQFKTINFVSKKPFYKIGLEFRIYFLNEVSFSSLFEDMIYLTRVDLSNFNKKVNDMSYMFKNCKSLEYVNFGDFDTSYVTNMNSMFYNTNLTFLDLSKFTTSSVNNMMNMFSNSQNLMYINLNNFQTLNVVKMKGMFYKCKSLMFLNLYSFQENKTLEIDSIFSETNDDLIYCINDNAEKIKNELRSKTNPNNCAHNCFQESKKLYPNKKICLNNCNDDEDGNLYEINNICYYNNSKENEMITNIITIAKDVIDNCSTEEFFKGLCDSQMKDLSIENKDNIISNIEYNIINEQLNSLLSEITSGEKTDFCIREDDIVFQITTTENLKNNENNNISTMDFGKCEDILKEKYKIDKNDSLIIFKIDYYMEGLLFPVIGYEFFHPENKSKLDLSYCKDLLINYNIPVSINEDELIKYDPNSEYYNDDCTSSKSKDGTDMTLNDRKIEYTDNNMSLCEYKCNFSEYNTDTKKSVCLCEIKSKIYSISEILNSKDIISKDFNTENMTSSSASSVNTMKCFNTVFSKYGLLKNLGNYILLLIIIVFSVSSIFFYKVGYNLLENEIKQILAIKEKNEQNINIYQFEKHCEKKKIKKKKKKKSKNFSIYTEKVGNPSRKSLKKNMDQVDSINTGKDINIHKSFSKVELRNSKANNYINSPKIEEKSENNIFNIQNYIDYEINFSLYKDALKIDKRTLIQIYLSLLKAKHPLFFSFVPIRDYNTMIIKIDIFLLSFAIIYAMNAAFFNESTIHQIYEDKGAYNLSYFLPKIIYAFIIGHAIIVLLKYIFLSHKNILEIKNQETRSQAAEKVDKVKKCLVIKYIIFYASGVLFLILFWYFLSSFCAVYQNSQTFLIINTFISFAISFLYPFFINLIPGIIRKISLDNNNREIIYKVNIYLQLI